MHSHFVGLGKMLVILETDTALISKDDDEDDNDDDDDDKSLHCTQN